MTSRERRLKILVAAIAASAVLLVFGGLMSMVMMVTTTMGTISGSQADTAAGQADGLKQAFGVDDDTTRAVMNGSQQAGIQWHIMSAILQNQQTATGGQGPYHATGDSNPTGPDGSPVADDDLDDWTWWLASQLAQGIKGAGGDPGMDIATGATPDMDSLTWTGNDTWSGRIEKPWTQALAGLPVVGAGPDWANQVLDQALKIEFGLLPRPVDCGQQVQAAGGATNQSQEDHARTIVGVAKSMGFGPNLNQAVMVAFMAAFQESGFRNLANDGVKNGRDTETVEQLSIVAKASMGQPHDGVGSDHDSVGLFQERPVVGWAHWPHTAPSMDQLSADTVFLMNTVWQAQVFFLSLQKVSGWQTMPPTQAAQAVERSRYPDAYAQHQQAATALMVKTMDAPPVTLVDVGGSPAAGGAGGGQGVLAPCGVGVAVSGTAQAVLDAARARIGMPYAWGGGTYDGPSNCIGGGYCGGQPGFDCSGLTRYAFYQGTGYKIGPRTARDIYAAGASMGMQVVPWPGVDGLLAGDLVFFSRSGPASISHVAMANGNGGYVEAGHVGVTERKAWTLAWMGVLRPAYTPAGAAVGGSAQQLSQQLLDLIGSGAASFNQGSNNGADLANMAAGKPAYGNVTVSAKVLSFLVDLATVTKSKGGKLDINALTSGGPAYGRHTDGSNHYNGTAVDLGCSWAGIRAKQGQGTLAWVDSIATKYGMSDGTHEYCNGGRGQYNNHWHYSIGGH